MTETDPARSLVVTSPNGSLQRRMLGAGALKGDWRDVYEERLSQLQHSLVP